MVDDISGLSNISGMAVNNASRKHDYGKEKAEKNGDVFNRLYDACLKGQLSVTKNILENHNTTAMSDEDGQTALYAACVGDHPEMASLLIESGYDVNHQDVEGETPLHVALENNAPDLTLFLLEAGADVKMVKSDGNTSLHIAVYGNCNKQTLQQIIDKGVSVNALNNRRETALVCACKSAQGDSVKVLLKAGADPKIADAQGYTCLHTAVLKSCSKEILQTIIDHGADVNATDKQNASSLTIACDIGDEDAINVLLKAGADANNADLVYGNSCLYSATLGGCSKETLQAMIDHGADVNGTIKNGVTALTAACSKGNINAINVLLKAGADPKIAHGQGYTCLHTAVLKSCSKEILQTIIDHGADVNSTDKDNVSALTIACCNGDADAINVLLKSGADANNADVVYGNACLYSATLGGCSKETLQAIIDHGADVNGTCKSGVTALMAACSEGNINAINVLLNAGADLNITEPNNGYTCLHEAACGDFSGQALQTLIDYGAVVNVTTNIKSSPLICAYHKGNAKAINVLLKAGACVNHADNFNGSTCLHHAITGNCSAEILQAVIGHGADVNAANGHSKTALMLACQKGNTNAINVLLKSGADPNITDVEGNTCLRTAVLKSCSKETLQAIIDHGADVNAADKDNETALLAACQCENTNAIDVLLKAGANPNIANAEGYTCLFCAVIRRCRKETLQAIIDHGADVNATCKGSTALMAAFPKGNTSAINVLLNAGADAKIADDEGSTCLHYAAGGDCSKKVLQTLIECGGDVNVTNKTNKSPLIIACQKGKTDVVHVLLDAGADPSVADTTGNTCLHYASLAGNCSKQVLQTVIDHGADVNAINKMNASPLSFACSRGNADAINVLLKAGAYANNADEALGGNTCLHLAVLENCSKETLQTIIDHGADVNAANKYDVTALLIAREIGHEDAINVLLKAGADPSIGDDGKTAQTIWLHSLGGYRLL